MMNLKFRRRSDGTEVIAFSTDAHMDVTKSTDWCYLPEGTVVCGDETRIVPGVVLRRGCWLVVDSNTLDRDCVPVHQFDQEYEEIFGNDEPQVAPKE